MKIIHLNSEDNRTATRLNHGALLQECFLVWRHDEGRWWRVEGGCGKERGRKQMGRREDCRASFRGYRARRPYNASSFNSHSPIATLTSSFNSHPSRCHPSTLLDRIGRRRKTVLVDVGRLSFTLESRPTGNHHEGHAIVQSITIGCNPNVERHFFTCN